MREVSAFETVCVPLNNYDILIALSLLIRVFIALI